MATGPLFRGAPAHRFEGLGPWGGCRGGRLEGRGGRAVEVVAERGRVAELAELGGAASEQQPPAITMRFPLDLIWLGKDGEVVRVDRGVAPRRHKACRRARSVVEANAGTADAFVAALDDAR